MKRQAKRYDIDTDKIMFEGGERFDIAALAALQTPWWNRTLSSVNGAVVRLGVLDGDFHWHRHEKEDEFFFVLEGRLDIELEDRMISLSSGQAVTIPAGVMHFPHARGRTVVLMVEQASVKPTGD